MNRPKLVRSLRIAWSVAWGLLAVLLCVLWVRSYWHNGYLGYIVAGGRELHLTSWNDRLRLFWQDFDPSYPSTSGLDRLYHFLPPTIGAPFWFLITVSIGIAVAPSLRWSKRFSLRT